MLLTRLRVVVVLAATLLVAWPAAGVRAQTETPAPQPADAFFDDSVVHTIYLAINSRDWQSLKTNNQDNTYYPSDFKWNNVTVRNIGIRSRGTGSRSGIKPGLRVDFDRYTSNQKFLGLKSFILRNDVQDASTMHERISMLFFRRMGLQAPREAHARLYVNNAYAGLYTIVESVDKDFLKRTYEENDGYLYKYDYNRDDQPYYLEWRGSDPSNYVPHPFKPETHENDPRGEVIAELIRIINQDSEAIFRRTIGGYLDLEKFIRHIAVEAFLGDNDGFNGNYGTNNFYVYRFEIKKLFTFIAWDKSNAFMDGPEYPIWHNIYDVPEANRNRLTMRALAYADLKSLYLDTLLTCAQSLEGWMETEIEREYAQITEFAAVSNEDTQYYSKAQFEQEVGNLRIFARQRGASVRGQVAQARGQ